MLRQLLNQKAPSCVVLSIAVAAAGCGPCDRPALPREEAFRQAEAYIDQMKEQYEFGKAGPILAKEELDRPNNLWTFEFRANDCLVLIATDACGGADVSGINAACKAK